MDPLAALQGSVLDVIADRLLGVRAGDIILSINEIIMETQFDLINTISQSELNKNQEYLALNTGTAVGRIHIIDKLDDTVEIGTRNIKVALRRLRKWARTGAADELDLPGTISSTARQGWLDVQMRPERHNAVKLLLFLDVGGSMESHVRLCEELFSAARTEFRHLEYFYFHNCIY